MRVDSLGRLDLDIDVDSVTVWLVQTTADVRDCARRLALAACAAALGLPARLLALANEPDGRPLVRVAGHTGIPRHAVDALHLALSHTRGAAAVALTGLGPVGVDVERLRPLPALALARRWMHQEEARWLADLSDVDQHEVGFFHLWTQKEAVGKALGLGLRRGGMRRQMPPPTSVDGRVVFADRLAPVPGLADMAVLGWPVGADLLLAVACAAQRALQAPVVFRSVAPRSSPGELAEGHDDGFAAAARSTARSRTSLPVAVRGSCATT